MIIFILKEIEMPKNQENLLQIKNTILRLSLTEEEKEGLKLPAEAIIHLYSA